MEIPEQKDFNKWGWQMRGGCLCGEGHSTKCCGFASDLVAAAVKEERERCAKIAEETFKHHFRHSEKLHAGQEIAKLIRT